MAHFAELDSNNQVLRVLVVNDSDTAEDGVEKESVGITFLKSQYGSDTIWKQTSYNDKIRGNYAGIGMTYIENKPALGVGSTDIFVWHQPYSSWSIGSTCAYWVPPNPPGDPPALSQADKDAGKYYMWSESNYNANPSTAWVLKTDGPDAWNSPVGW